MKKNLILISFLFLGACKNQEEASIDGSQVNGQQLATAITTILDSIVNVKDMHLADSGIIGPMSADIIRMCTNIPTTREQLSSLRTVIKILDGKSNAGVSVPGFGGLTLSKEELSVSTYYVEPAIVQCGDTQKVFGIGYSFHLLIRKLGGGLDASKLPYIAASVQLNSKKNQVFYSQQTFGIAGIPIVKFFRPVINKPFDVEGFGIMQSSIDGIHNILSDSVLSAGVRIQPIELKFVSPKDL